MFGISASHEAKGFSKEVCCLISVCGPLKGNSLYLAITIGLTSKQYETTKVCDSANIAEIFSVCSACITRDCTAQDVKEPVLIRTPRVGMYDKEEG